MTPRTLLSALALAPWIARAEESSAPEAPPAEEVPTDENSPPADEPDVLSPYRLDFAALTAHALGTTSRPVAFAWRRSRAQVAGTWAMIAELNTFDSTRAGALLRLPNENSLLEISVSRVWTWDTPSSEMLALTPYRQAGHPTRYEIEVGTSIPLAEGIVTAKPRYFPALEMVFSGYGAVRMRVYPQGFAGMKITDALKALAKPTLSEAELENLEEHRPDAMAVDPARFGVMLGVGDEIYLQQGIFVSPRLMVALPLLAVDSDMLFWTELSVAAGAAF